MKFKVKSSELVAMLKIVIKGYDSRDDSSFIFFKIENDKLIAVSDSQSSYFKGQVEITGFSSDDDDGNIFYVSGEVLKRLVGIFPVAPVPLTFSINQSSRVFVIKYTGNSFRLPILSDANEVSEQELTKIGMIQANDFFDVFGPLVKIVSTDPATQDSPASCLHLKFADSKMRVMGTDTFAIAEITKDYTPDEDSPKDELNILIRQPQAALLIKQVNPSEVLTLVKTDSSFGYIDGNGVLSLVSKTAMEPLNYQSMKKFAKDDVSITTDYTDFKETLDTIGKLAFATNTIILKISSEGTVQLTSMQGDVMDLAVSDTSGIDVDQQYTFSRSVLSEALIPIDTHTIKIQWKKPDDEDEDPRRVFQFVPIDDDGNAEKNVFILVVPNA